MIKGVNRQVVEVSQPESVYFEKVLFFVKPEFYGLGESKLKNKADALLKDSVNPPATKNKSKKMSFNSVAKFVVSALTGAAVTAIISVVFN